MSGGVCPARVRARERGGGANASSERCRPCTAMRVPPPVGPAGGRTKLRRGETCCSHGTPLVLKSCVRVRVRVRVKVRVRVRV